MNKEAEMSKDPYPTEDELDQIEQWDHEDPKGLMEFIREDLWWEPDWGFKLTGKKVLKLALHTGGWSGNESIIGALQRNMFWMLYWQRSDRGGHYYFRITKPKENTDVKDKTIR